MSFVCHQVLVSSELGGAGLNALRLAKWLQERAARSEVWTPGTGPVTQKIRELGLSHSHYAPAVYHRRAFSSAWTNLSLARVLRLRGRGIAHVHSSVNYGAMRLGLRLSGLKRIVNLHLDESAEGMRWAFQTPPDLIITCARFLVEQVRQALPAAQRGRTPIVVVPNSVRTERFFPGDKRQAKQQVGAPLDTPLVVMLANLAPHKGQETTSRAAALLKQRGVHVTCWLVGAERGGGDTHTTRLRSMIRELGVEDRVRLLGYRDDTAELLRAADFFLLPSTSEGLPLSILEAQATKVPVLAAPTAGIPEVIADGRTGFLIQADDAVGYARQIETLVANPNLSHRVAENAYEKTIREHRWETYCERIWEIYLDLIGGRTVQGGRESCN